MRNVQIPIAGLMSLFFIAPPLNFLGFWPTVLVQAQEGSSTRRRSLPPARPAGALITLVVHLPADAVLEIEGMRTRPTGTVRRFVSPPVAAGKMYRYTLKATWREGGKLVSRQRVVSAIAGKPVTVDFRQDDPLQKREPHQKRADGSQKR